MNQINYDIWEQCKGCQKPIYAPDFKKNLKVCPYCGHHHRLSAQERIAQLTEAFDAFKMAPVQEDPLQFFDTRSYKERLEKASVYGQEAMLSGYAVIGGSRCVLSCFDFGFIGGSMGIAVGENFLDACLKAIEAKLPLVLICASGGARMQEGLFSLMQMAKVSAAIAKLNQSHIPFIAILTDPTTGGVSASLATLADLIWAESGALIGFTGPRVIEQTVRQKLPDGFQRAEFLYEHGLIDQVVCRSELPEKLRHFLELTHAVL